MKRWLKLMILPVSIACCSMSVNSSSIEFSAFAIEKEDLVAGTFKLSAYINVLVSTTKKSCDYRYSWMGNDGIKHPCGSSGFATLSAKDNVLLYGCGDLNIDTLKLYSPITFTCEVDITNEPTQSMSMPYSAAMFDELTISESTNNQEVSTGYIKESTFTDPTLNYHYEDTFIFNNFEDLKVNELYYDLDISFLKFKYRNGLDDILHGDFKFAFYDRYNLFPDFPVSETSLYRYIPLTFNKDEEECYFTFTPTIYYDPKTHESSLSQKDGYLPYDHLMLPFTGAAELKFLPCFIELKVQSHTDFTLTGKFMMTYVKKYFGDCVDSEFCDEMHQDDEVNVREKIVEVTI